MTFSEMSHNQAIESEAAEDSQKTQNTTGAFGPADDADSAPSGSIHLAPGEEQVKGVSPTAVSAADVYKEQAEGNKDAVQDLGDPINGGDGSESEIAEHGSLAAAEDAHEDEADDDSDEADDSDGDDDFLRGVDAPEAASHEPSAPDHTGAATGTLAQPGDGGYGAFRTHETATNATASPAPEPSDEQRDHTSLSGEPTVKGVPNRQGV